MEIFVHGFTSLGPVVQILLIAGIIWITTLVTLSRRAEKNLAGFFYDIVHIRRRRSRPTQPRSKRTADAPARTTHTHRRPAL